MLDMLKQVGSLRENGAKTAAEFDPSWLIRAIAAQVKKMLLDTLARDPKIETLATRLQTSPENAQALWDAFLLHLKEDY
jgi:hypothetical protein